MRRSTLQRVQVSVDTDAVALGGGLDIISGPYSVKPGVLRFAINYEALVTGGYERARGYERFDGRARPSDATYAVAVPATTFSGLVVGDTVTGATSGVTGKLMYISAAGWIALTRMTGAFTVGENLQVGGITKGVYSSDIASIDGFVDNAVLALCADEYRASIAKPAGSGPIRGVAILGADVFAWRDNAGGTACNIWKASATGWQAVTLFHEVSFTAGSAAYAEGATITQGGNSATVKRVVLETGDWGAGTAAGRLIITAPAPAAFAAGAAAGGGACTLSGANAAITLLPGGRVETDAHNFGGAVTTRRLYGCDGVNREFEFDGTVYVPISTGMSARRASYVKCHKSYLWFAFGSSLQKSAVGSPYQWSAVLGAAELAAGDTITGLLSVGGSEAQAAMMVFCLNSALVLYGSDTASFKLTPLSDEAGASAWSVQDMGRPMVHDVPGFRAYSPTQSYGNFSWELASRAIEPLARQKTPVCSVFSKSLGRYRCFFADGTAVSATPWGKGFAWMPLSLPIKPVVATSAEVSGVTRTFYGTEDGWVVEADVGRSFDGAAITHAFKLSQLHQKSPLVIKQYRAIEAECLGNSAFSLSMGAEFLTADPDAQQDYSVEFEQLALYGNALVWSGSSWGQAQWGAGELSRKRARIPGQGVAISPIFGGSSASELHHQITSLFIHYTGRRIAR